MPVSDPTPAPASTVRLRSLAWMPENGVSPSGASEWERKICALNPSGFDIVIAPFLQNNRATLSALPRWLDDQRSRPACPRIRPPIFRLTLVRTATDLGRCEVNAMKVHVRPKET